MEKRQLYRFGPFGLDAVAKVLLKDGEPVRLNRKAAETLLILAERSPQVVTREEILSAVWQDRVVDEANLAQNIAVVRRALSAEKGEPAYIETFPGRGYRLHGPVTVETESGPEPAAAPAHAPAAPSAPAPSPPARVRWPWIALLCVALLVPAAVYFHRRSDDPPLHVLPITRLSGQETQPALSPDGTKVAFVWQQDAHEPPGLWVQSLSDSSHRRLSPAQGSGAAAAWSSPAWSPDGRSIACLRFGSSSAAIVILPIDGGAEREVAPILPTRFGLAYTHIDWSPDGKTLAVDDTPALNQPLSIFLVDLQTGRKTRLTQPEEMIIGDVAPRFSPDGRRLSFIRAFHRSLQELFTVPVSGGTATQLTSDSRQISGHDWSASTSTLCFASSRGGEFRIWRVVPGKEPSPSSIYAEFPIQFSVARRAATLAYSVVQNDPNIWRLDFGPEPRWRRLIASSGQDASPQYSPDGRRIAFRSDRSGSEQIWVTDADGSGAIQVTRGSGRPSVPRWAPDSRTLVFNDASSQDLFLASDLGNTWSVRPFGQRGVHPVFSSDGRSIYAAGTGAISRFALQGGASEIVSHTRALSLGLSPDGRHLYFVREPADTTLSRMEIATGRAERVLEGLVPYCTSCWALSPQGIYYLGSRPKSSALQSLYFLDFRTHETRLLADYPEPILPIGIGPFSLSPDFKSLLAVRLDSPNSDILRVDGFR